MSKLPIPRPSYKISTAIQNLASCKSPPVTSRLGICKDFEKNDQKLRQLSSGHILKNKHLEIPRSVKKK